MMDEMAKKRAIQVWLRVLYVALWSIGVLALVIAATWLLALWRYAAFALAGVAIGAYLSVRGAALTDQIARAVLAIGASAFAAWLAVAASRDPALLAPLALSVGAFFLYGAATLGTVWVVRAICGRPIEVHVAVTEEPGERVFADVTAETETTLEAVPERTSGEEETAVS